MKAQNLSPNIRTAIQEFLEIFAVPEVAPENIFYGNQNNLALPPEGNDYVIYSYISSVRHGTSAEDWEQDQTMTTFISQRLQRFWFRSIATHRL